MNISVRVALLAAVMAGAAHPSTAQQLEGWGWRVDAGWWQHGPQQLRIGTVPASEGFAGGVYVVPPPITWDGDRLWIEFGVVAGTGSYFALDAGFEVPVVSVGRVRVPLRLGGGLMDDNVHLECGSRGDCGSFGWTGGYVRIGTGLDVRVSSRIGIRLIGELANHGRTAGPHRLLFGVGF